MSAKYEQRAPYRWLGAGVIVGATFSLALAGWLLHWNAYTNLMLTLGSGVLTATAITAAHDAAVSRTETTE